MPQAGFQINTLKQFCDWLNITQTLIWLLEIDIWAYIWKTLVAVSLNKQPNPLNSSYSTNTISGTQGGLIEWPIILTIITSFNDKIRKRLVQYV